MTPLAVVAIGGNALTGADQQGTAEQIATNAADTARCVAQLTRERGVLVVHGNGPQVGNLSIQQENAAALVPVQPLYQLGAMTQGQLGAVLVRELDRVLGPGAATGVITHVVVDPDDPAFADPVKPVGPFFDRARAGQLARKRGWQVREDAGRGYRRVVASPRPQSVVEIGAIGALLAAGQVVVAAGGGGIPVTRAADGSLHGIDGVIDKDHAAATLAVALKAQELYLLTGVDTVMVDFGTARQRPAHQLTTQQARAHLADGQFAAGSMGPKVEAALAFLAAGGHHAIITSTRVLPDVVAGKRGAGTHLVADTAAMVSR